MKLTESEIKKRLMRLHNLEHLHTAQLKRNEKLLRERKELKERVSILESVVAEQQKIITDLRLQLEEVRTIVFGKKRKQEEHDDIDDAPPQQKEPRTSESYHRPTPKEDEVTTTTEHPISTCNHCDGHLSEKEIVTYFVEDIPLPQQNVVVKHRVEKGYCEICKRWSTAEPLPSTGVLLGTNVKHSIAYLSIICRQSYGQIQALLIHIYNFKISQGEIAKILEREGEQMRPAYERLKAKIRGEPSVHLDETGWNLIIGDGYKRYGWTMTGGESSESVFVLGKTRGKGNATELLGDSKAVVVSDDYAAYRNIPNPHQLCLAHILRKLRDLATSLEITGDVHAHCVTVYQMFKEIYADIEKARKSENPKAVYDKLHARLKSFSDLEPRDPVKLSRIKKQVFERTENYLTCLLYPSVAADNNAAERSLRHLVLKRKISFGSFREKTADTLAILCSVLLSHKQNGTIAGYLRGV